jgi:hypothetical protein
MPVPEFPSLTAPVRNFAGAVESGLGRADQRGDRATRGTHSGARRTEAVGFTANIP